MKTTVGACLATALLDEKLNYGICFALVSSPTGVCQLEMRYHTNPIFTQEVIDVSQLLKLDPSSLAPEGFTQAMVSVESILYVQRLSDTNRPAQGGSAK
jgi:hypothetical protein